MRLYYEGHNERYAIEQSMFGLLPDERPLYPEEAFCEERAADPAAPPSLLARFCEETEAYFASCLLYYGGRRFYSEERAPAPPPAADELARTRLRRRLLQRCFYFCAVEARGAAPAWGMLSGVRPCKLPVRAQLAGATAEEAQQQLLSYFQVSPRRAALAMDCAREALAVQQSLAASELGLYLGIPFCPTRCHYCSFISAASNTNALMPPYLKTLRDELRLTGAAAREAGLVVGSVYMGGGTPTTLSASALSSLLADVQEHFPLQAGAECTVEAGRPDTITQEKLHALLQGGATRLSVNPQTLSDEILRGIGRAHTVADFYESYALSRSLGFDNINCDLIAGLPGDSEEGFAKSLTGLLALAPENITVHTFARKRGAALHRGAQDLPSEEALAHMLDGAELQLRAAGYQPYYLYRQKYISGGFENIGWCKAGSASRYNICMMEELCSILSLGAGAVSKKINYARGSLQRHANPKYPQEYLREASRMLEEKPNFAKSLADIEKQI